MCLAWLLLRVAIAHLDNEKFLLALICKHDLFYYICKSKTTKSFSYGKVNPRV